MEELLANAIILVRAGAETTATALSGLTYHLLTNAEALEKATLEVRSTFRDEYEITFSSVCRLNFLQACMNEALRLYPPIAVGMPRVSPRGGALICGHYVPEDVMRICSHSAKRTRWNSLINERSRLPLLSTNGRYTTKTASFGTPSTSTPSASSAIPSTRATISMPCNRS